MELNLRTKKEYSSTKTELAQYFTPSSIAEYMAGMFTTARAAKMRILDAGAGEGILGLTLLRRLEEDGKDPDMVFVEMDPELVGRLKAKTAAFEHEYRIINDNFINIGLDWITSRSEFTHVIINPPYFKIRVDSPISDKLRSHGIHVTNIYAAFVWICAKLLSKRGELVAILPRSFCNGPYFLKFREFILANYSLDAIHTFISRDKAFSHDGILQENVIIRLSRNEQSESVRVTYSVDHIFRELQTKAFAYRFIVNPNDETKTIHIPLNGESTILTDYVSNTLEDLGLRVSTGPIVDFRSKDKIKRSDSGEEVPLLYPAHMSDSGTRFPIDGFGKIGQFYRAKPDDDKDVFPLNGCYVIIRRFSSKEEKRRIFASVVDPNDFVHANITFENHLNYYHFDKNGFDSDLAYGLCAYLNSTVLDEYFRRRSGHTQVNVNDLKSIPYPDKKALQKLGKMAKEITEVIDSVVRKEITGVR